MGRKTLRVLKLLAGIEEAINTNRGVPGMGERKRKQSEKFQSLVA
jgi:hypothetical protein